MDMNWVLGLVIIGAIVAFTTMVIEGLKRPRLKNHHELRAEITVLEGKLAVKDIEIEVWKDRGTRYSYHADSQVQNYNKLVDIFTKMIGDASQIEHLKELLKQTNNEKRK